MGFEYVSKYVKKTKEDPKIVIIDVDDYLEKLIKKTSPLDFKTKQILKYFVSTLHTDDICLTSNYEEMRAIRSYFGINTEYIQPYIDESFFINDGSELKDSFSNPALFSNKIDYKQNSLDLFIKAVKYIKNKTDFIEKHNLLIDVTAFGNDYSKFVKEVNKQKLSDYFRFVSIVPYENYPEYLRKHKFTIVLPKNDNMHSRIILESMASGVPVLIDSSFNKHSDPYIRAFMSRDSIFSADTMNETVKDTLNGFVFESGNPVDLAEKIMLMSSQDLADVKRNAFETALKFKPIYFDTRILDIVKIIVEKSNKDRVMSEI